MFNMCPPAFVSAVCVVCVQVFTVRKKAQEIPERKKELRKKTRKNRAPKFTEHSCEHQEKGEGKKMLHMLEQVSTMWHVEYLTSERETEVHAQPVNKQEENERRK